MGSYALSNVTMMVGFVPIKGGYADDDAVIEVEQVDPDVTVVQGASGHVVFCQNAKKLVKVTAKFLQTSINNLLLSGIKDAQSSNGPSPFLLLDTNGVTVIAGEESMIEGMPKGGWGPAAKAREWVMYVDAQIYLEGGNQT